MNFEFKFKFIEFKFKKQIQNSKRPSLIVDSDFEIQISKRVFFNSRFAQFRNSNSGLEISASSERSNLSFAIRDPNTNLEEALRCFLVAALCLGLRQRRAPTRAGPQDGAPAKLSIRTPSKGGSKQRQELCCGTKTFRRPREGLCFCVPL